MNELVKYNNNFNNISLRNFSSNELDILMAICSRMKEKGEQEITFHFDKLKKLIKYSDNTPATFVKDLESAYDKLISIKLRIGDNRNFVKFVLFTRYAIDSDKQTVDIAVNKEFAWVLNELNVNFTQFELAEYIELKSSYSKEFYRRMKQFKHTGVWRVSLEEFKRLLDIPVNYRMCDIDAKVLRPIEKELKEKFAVSINKIYNKKSKGRPAVTGFEFKFKKEYWEKLEKVSNEEITFPLMEDFMEIDYLNYSYLNRTVRIKDKKMNRYNYLSIKSIKIKDNKIVVSVENRDDGYINEFSFDNRKHLENWFSVFGI